MMQEISSQFKEKMTNLLGEKTSQFFASLETPCKKAITLNTYRITKEKFENLADFQYSKIPEVDNGYIVDNFKFGSHILNHMGAIYSQEPSSMYPVEMLDIKKGDIVLDLCSAPGGKSTQILEKLEGEGLLVANEIVYNRAKILYENLNRMGFKNFIITCASPQEFENLDIRFDKILVDAPCGGEGMFRRDNFDFSSYNNASIETNAKRQLSILGSIKNLLKPGGKLVYSTCTYDILENENIINEFLNENSDYKLIDYPRLNGVTCCGVKLGNHPTNYCKRRYPHLFEGEGQFMALLQRDNFEEEEKSMKFSAKGFEPVYKKDVEILRSTFKDVADIKGLDIYKRNDNYYVKPDTDFGFKGINVLSIGVLLGTLNKGVIKISHEMYHSYSDIFYNQLELDKKQIEDYLKGYEVDIDEKLKGICVVTYQGIAIGGGKQTNGKLKNYYPKNLRN